MSGEFGHRFAGTTCSAGAALLVPTSANGSRSNTTRVQDESGATDISDSSRGGRMDAPRSGPYLG